MHFCHPPDLGLDVVKANAHARERLLRYAKTLKTESVFDKGRVVSVHLPNGDRSAQLA